MKLSYSCFDTVAFAGVTKETMFLHNGLDFFVLLGIAPDVDDDAAKDKLNHPPSTCSHYGHHNNSV